LLVPIFNQDFAFFPLVLVISQVGQFYWQVQCLGLVKGPHPGWFCWQVWHPSFVQDSELFLVAFKV